MKIIFEPEAPATSGKRKLEQWVTLLVLVTATTIIVGCESPAVKLDQSVIQQVHNGQDRAEVRKLLGSPNWSRRGANGETADTYIYSDLVYSASSAASSARDLKVRTFSIRYDTSGQATDTLLYDSRTPAIMIRGQAFAGPTVTEEAVSRIRNGVTTREELEQMFHKPIVANLHPGRGVELHWYQIEVGATVTHLEDERGLHVLVDEQGIVRDFALSDTHDRQK